MIETKIIPRVFLAELFGLGNRLLINTAGGGLPQFETVYGNNGQGLPEGAPELKDPTGYRAMPYRLDLTNRWGLPVFTSVKLKHGSLELDMPDAIIEINRPKVVVKTQIAGRDGTVKEIVSWDDYQITVRAILTNGLDATKTINRGEPNEKTYSTERWYPDEEVLKFVNICDHHGRVELIEPFFSQLHSGNKVVIESFNLINTPQVTNMQVIEFKCVSDEDIALELAKK